MKEITSLYIHFPYCKEICNYCDFYKRKLLSEDDYRLFERSLEQQADKLEDLLRDNGDKLAPLQTLYIGGGTPSLWQERGITFLNDLFVSRGWSLAANGEFTLEINPEIDNLKSLDTWRQWGINRFSVGVQSCDDEVLKRIGRTHQFDDVKQCLDYVASSGVNFSLDLMLNLPSNSQRDLSQEFRTLLKFNPNHFSVYMMTVGSNYPHSKMLLGETELEREYFQTSEILAGARYEHYEISNFCRPEFKSKHNMLYWHGENVAALGASATGFFKTAGGGSRFKWLISRDDFQLEQLSSSEFLLERVYLALRTSDGVTTELLEQYIGAENISKFKDYLIESSYLRREGLISLNTKGFLMLDSVMDKLFCLAK